MEFERERKKKEGERRMDRTWIDNYRGYIPRMNESEKCNEIKEDGEV